MKWTRICLAILASFMASCGPAHQTGESTAKPSAGEATSIRMGAIDPLTGPFAAYGEPVRDGMLLAVEEINSAGGIGGHRIEFILEDDEGDPKNAVAAFTKLATVDKVPIVVGPLSSGASMATAPLANRYKVVQISTLAGTIDLSGAGPFVFRIYPSSEIGSRYIAGVAVEKFKAKRVGILYPNNVFGVTSRKFVSEVFAQAGVEVVAEEAYKDGDKDFRTQLTKIAQGKPDLLICSAYYEEGALILVQARQLGLNVPVLGEDGWFGPIAGTAGEAIQNLYFANARFGREETNSPAMQAFITSYQRRYGRTPNSYAAAGHAAVHVAKFALEHAAHDGEALRSVLKGLVMDTAFGSVRYADGPDNLGAVYDLYQLDASNEAVRVAK